MQQEGPANLLDTPAASKLGPYRALFYDEEEGRLEKFRPYGLPAEGWLRQVKAWLTGQAIALACGGG
jgi:S-DNA-T family DNA segregation ATPase FtsK/SpoIIIE